MSYPSSKNCSEYQAHGNPKLCEGIMKKPTEIWWFSFNPNVALANYFQ
jgi:hypothetical protein